MPKKHSDIVRWLRENGPATNDEAPFASLLTLTTRRYGIRRLRPMTTAGSGRGTGNVTPVYYFPDHHSTDDVIATFFEVNPQWMEMPQKSLTQRLPTEFADALHRYLEQEGDDA